MTRQTNLSHRYAFNLGTLGRYAVYMIREGPKFLFHLCCRSTPYGFNLSNDHHCHLIPFISFQSLPLRYRSFHDYTA